MGSRVKKIRGVMSSGRKREVEKIRTLGAGETYILVGFGLLNVTRSVAVELGAF